MSRLFAPLVRRTYAENINLVVRAALLPATMKLLGDWNWYVPRWLEWLPRLRPPESEALPTAAGAAPVSA